MKTKITELLGIEYPIVQGAMAWIAEHHLAAAVSKAGGLGIIAGILLNLILPEPKETDPGLIAHTVEESEIVEERK